MNLFSPKFFLVTWTFLLRVCKFEIEFHALSKVMVCPFNSSQCFQVRTLIYRMFVLVLKICIWRGFWFSWIFKENYRSINLISFEEMFHREYTICLSNFSHSFKYKAFVKKLKTFIFQGFSTIFLFSFVCENISVCWNTPHELVMGVLCTLPSLLRQISRELLSWTRCQQCHHTL